MASHQTSPQGGVPLHHRPPPGHVQPNGPVGPAPYAAQQRQQFSPTEYLNRLNEETWLCLGRLSETMGNNEAALGAYNRVLHFNQFSLEALQAIAAVLRAEEKYDQAVEYIDSILKLDHTDGESWSHLGHCFLMMDELQKAYAAYQSALYNLQDPKEPKLWYGIGILYDRYGSLDHAEEAFSQVMRMAPHFDKANEIYFRLGIIYKQQNKFPQSLECFRWIAENPPHPLNQTDILFQIGHVHEQQNDFDAAKAAYRRVLERDPNHAKVLQQLGWLHHQESADYHAQEQAIEFLEKSVRSDQNDAQSWYLLGRCYMSQQKFPKAYEAYQQAVYRDGRNPTFWCSIGVLYYQINQYRDALDAYSRAIRLNPNISEVWYDLGTLYQSCNNQTSDALDAYQRAAELDPNNPHIKSRLQHLRSGHAGPASQNGAPMPHDDHPQTYEPAATNGPPQPSWAPSLSQASAHRGPPPQPMPSQREWGPRGPEMHNGPPLAPPQPPPVHPYDPREMPRVAPPPPTGRPHSPRLDAVRHHEQYRHTPAHRPPSPSPRMRNSVPSAYRTPQAMAAGPLPPSMPPQQQPPQPTRITNPNYGSQPMPPNSSMGAPIHQSSLPPYGRGPTPPANVRPMMDSRPHSPRGASMYGHPPPPLPPQQAPMQHHPDPAGRGMMSLDGPPPLQAHGVAVEAGARERDDRYPRERDDRIPPMSSAPKRHREWEEREESVYKKNATDETRARLENPHLVRRGPSPPMPRTVSDYERTDREIQRVPIGGPASSSAHSGIRSPDATRRIEDQRRADANYRPSEYAHHPQTHPPIAQHEEKHHLPPMNSAFGPLPQEPKREITPVKAEDPPRQEESLPHASAEKQNREREDRMQIDEPAARKMDVDEDYDEDSTEEGRTKASHGNSGGVSRSSPKSSKAGSGPPSASIDGQHGMSNGSVNGSVSQKNEA